MNDYSGVITRFINQVEKNEPLVIYGDGSQTRDFVNVLDIVDAICVSIKNGEAEGQIINVGSGKATSINELAKTILELVGTELNIRHEKLRDGEIKYSYSDIAKAKRLLGYEPKVNLKDGLQLLLREKTLVAN